jgi:hypothetical protein
MTKPHLSAFISNDLKHPLSLKLSLYEVNK